MKLIIIFTILSVINVIFSTVRSIVTIKGGKLVASLVSAGYFAFYNVVMIYTMSDFDMWIKCVITFACNLVGVYLVKLMEEKMRKDKLWCVQATVPTYYLEIIDKRLEDIPHSYIRISDKHTLFSFYCDTQKESIAVKEVCSEFGAKFFASEAQIF